MGFERGKEGYKMKGFKREGIGRKGDKTHHHP
jgi:hypothetical protein